MRYKACVIGCGRIGVEFDKDPKRKNVSTHTGAYKKSDMFDLVGVCDINQSKVAKYSKELKVHGYTDVKDMLTVEEPDIVSICTPPDSHYELVKQAVSANIKGIFCEKPIAHSLEDARKMVELCDNNNVLLQIGHQRRFCHIHQTLKTMIKDGEPGKPQQASFYYTSGIFNTGSHMFDLIRFFFGDPTYVYAIESHNEENYDGLLEFKNGLTCTFQSLDVSNYQIFEFDMYFTKWRVRTLNCNLNIQFYRPNESEYFSGYKELIPGGIIKTDLSGDYMVYAVNHLINCIEESKQSISSGHDGLKALELIHACRESHIAGERVNV